ncbi:TPA: hypothetical protein NKA88_004477 [Vibrio parahaemolyticus]|uniref:hypothetical protein n=1 Tax=Vibrio parahaemolyticus TaxID=670 RepID=UPI0011127915|nr:hypothetical protein [Vibrio parahaemolyticus]EGQ8527869.1 hypothetical protein [Vibrio parahaemolyticus]EGQ9211876.1 hypothetical protein [Vibrio parahaemolyticus]EGQ9789634.1 hypothetical protein [Vibrio parahaemolyticus]EGQ9926334.1 hypothetical protein [Vibrio parahaemolyticus]EGR0121170.1 hypothetical protein [Vibrio parahaemolyticus]
MKFQDYMSTLRVELRSRIEGLEKIELLAFKVSVVWLLVNLLLLVYKRDDLKNITLNEWGDFLAGFTAPLAFLWIIVGYFLQRKELQQNTEALLFQRDELSKQTNELAEQNIYHKERAEQAKLQTKELVNSKVKALQETMNSNETEIIVSEAPKISSYSEVKIGNKDLFSIIAGRRYHRNELQQSSGEIPVYTANLNHPSGYVESSSTIDINFSYIVLSRTFFNDKVRVFNAGEIFEIANDLFAIQVKSNELVASYIAGELAKELSKLGYGYSKKLTKLALSEVKVRIPTVIKDDLSKNKVAFWDKKKQKDAVAYFDHMNKIRKQAIDAANSIKTPNLDLFED